MFETCLATSGLLLGVAPLSVTEPVLDLTKPASMNFVLLAVALKVSELAELSAVAETWVVALSALTKVTKSANTSDCNLTLANETEVLETAKLAKLERTLSVRVVASMVVPLKPVLGALMASCNRVNVDDQSVPVAVTPNDFDLATPASVQARLTLIFCPTAGVNVLNWTSKPPDTAVAFIGMLETKA
ncbi:hypothetical protein MCEMAEM4_03385 [Burkholderiaceae bacterium]